MEVKKPVTNLNKKQSGGFVKSALILTISGIIAKIFGAVYRIPLTNMLGTYGIGVYQLIFPLYALLVTLSAAGIPTAVAKLVSEKIELNEYAQAKAYFLTALKFLTAFGAFLALLLFISADFIGNLQKNTDTIAAYRLIAAAILIECSTAAFKGWFHGRMNMKPTAISQICEQGIKMAVGLISVYLCLPNILKGVYAAVLTVTLSEFTGLIVMVIMFLKENRKERLFRTTTHVSSEETKHCLRVLISMSIPLTLTSIVIPVSHLIDSFLVQNLITLSNRTELYGLWSGPVHSLLSMPAVLTSGIAASVVPGMAKSFASGNKQDIHEKLNTAFALTFSIALPCTIGLAMLGGQIGSLLYPGLNSSEINIFAKLTLLGAPTIIAMAVLMTGTSVLQAQGKMYVPVIALTIGTAVKCVMDIFLYSNNDINIYGEGISNSVCYIIASTIILWYIVKVLRLKIEWWTVCAKPLIASTIMCIALSVMRLFFMRAIDSIMGTLTAIIIAAIIYGTILLLLWWNQLKSRRGLIGNK